MQSYTIQRCPARATAKDALAIHADSKVAVLCVHCERAETNMTEIDRNRPGLWLLEMHLDPGIVESGLAVCVRPPKSDRIQDQTARKCSRRRARPQEHGSLTTAPAHDQHGLHDARGTEGCYLAVQIQNPGGPFNLSLNSRRADLN